MRILLRIFGTWLLGMTLILLVMDGTKSLAANSVVMTGFGDIWGLIHGASLIALEQMIEQGWKQTVWDYCLQPALGWPAWAVIGVPSLLMIIVGQPKKRR